jgi:O-antigen/teichoic acid export membrane protein
MSQFKKLLGETALYGMSSILGRMLSYLLVPLYTSVFVPAEYGIVTELYAYTAFFNVVYTYGLETAYFRFASRNQNEGKIFSTAFNSILLSSILLSVLLVIFATPIVNLLNYPGKENLIIWLAFILAIDAIVAIPFAKLRQERKALQFAIAKLINIFLNITLNLFFLVFSAKIHKGAFLPELIPFINLVYRPDFGVEYVFLSNLIANAALILLLWKIIKKVQLEWDWPTLKPMLIYAYPLLFMGLAGVTNDMLSRALLRLWLPEGFYENYSNLAALGIFGACYKLSVFMALVIQAFRYAAEPFFFSQSKEKNSPETFSQVMHYFIISCTFIFLAISINLDIIAPIFLRQDSYLEGLHIVPILLLAYMFLGIYYNLSIWFKLSDKTYFGTWISLTGSSVTVVFNFLLIPVMGFTGSAIVSFLCYFFMSVLCYIYGQKHYPIPYRTFSGMAYITLTALVVWGVLNIHIESLLISKAFHFFVIAAFIILVFIIERKNLKRQIR